MNDKNLVQSIANDICRIAKEKKEKYDLSYTLHYSSHTNCYAKPDEQDVFCLEDYRVNKKSKKKIRLTDGLKIGDKIHHQPYPPVHYFYGELAYIKPVLQLAIFLNLQGGHSRSDITGVENWRLGKAIADEVKKRL